MSRRAGYAALAVLLAAGCSGDEAPPSMTAAVNLTEGNRDANAPAIAAFFNRTCLQAGDSAGAVADAVGGSGWENDQVQSATSALPIAAWRLEHGELVHSTLALGPGNNFIDCELRLDAGVAPSLERVRDALRPLLQRASLRELSGGPPEARWQWQAGERDERVLTVGPAEQAGGQPRLSLHLRITQTAPAPAVPEPDNEIGGDILNVQ